MSQPLRPASLDTLRYLRRALSSNRPSSRSPAACRAQKPSPTAKAPFSTSHTHRDRSSAAAQPSAPSSAPSTPSPPHTHYSLFPQTLPAGPPPAGPFTPDARSLRAEFLALQARAHPDRASGTSTKGAAHALSARINDAYRTLAAPLPRALYLLRLRGAGGADDEEALLREGEGEGEGRDHQDVLMEVLELRERIEEASTEEEVERMRAENDARIAECVCALEEAFREDDLRAAKRLAVRLRYWVNVEDVLREWEKGKPVVLEHKE